MIPRWYRAEALNESKFSVCFFYGRTGTALNEAQKWARSKGEGWVLVDFNRIH